MYASPTHRNCRHVAPSAAFVRLERFAAPPLSQGRIKSAGRRKNRQRAPCFGESLYRMPFMYLPDEWHSTVRVPFTRGWECHSSEGWVCRRNKNDTAPKEQNRHRETLKYCGFGGFWWVVSDHSGRALEWHSRGQRFDPAYLHQTAVSGNKWTGSRPFCFLRSKNCG